MFPISIYRYGNTSLGNDLLQGCGQSVSLFTEILTSATLPGSLAPCLGVVALDLDDRYRGWQMGLTASIAIVPAECFELVDRLIVY